MAFIDQGTCASSVKFNLNWCSTRLRHVRFTHSASDADRFTYGSVAQHEERALDEPDTSDVDLLVVVNGNRDAVRSQLLALVHTAGLAASFLLLSSPETPYGHAH